MIKKFSVFNCHRIGAAHIAKNLCCEDYSCSYNDSDHAIVAVSDGHGDKNCFRSHKGAELACKAAVDTIKSVLSKDEELHTLKTSPDRVIVEIEKSMIFRWNALVEDDLLQNPITDSELSGLDGKVIEAIKNHSKAHKVYGCTLVSGCFTDDFWFGIHIGDGKCVIIQKNGLYRAPIPWDDGGCVGNRSTSICSSSAFEDFRYAYGSEVPAALFLSSDGVDESFDENGLNKLYYTLASWLKTLSTQEFDEKLDDILKHISQNGSGDDVSIACIINDQLEIKKPLATSLQVAEKMEELYLSLRDAEKRYTELEIRDKEISSESEKLQSEIKELERQLSAKRNEFDDRKNEQINISRSISNLRGQLSDLTEQFEKSKVMKKSVDDYWQKLGEDIVDNPEIMRYSPLNTKNTHKNQDNAAVLNTRSNKDQKTITAKQEDIVEARPDFKQDGTDNSEVPVRNANISDKQDKLNNADTEKSGKFFANIFRRNK